MAMSCPTCAHTPVEYVETTEDAKTRLHCGDCGHDWLHSPPAPVPTANRQQASTRSGSLSLHEAKAHFPTENDVTAGTSQRLAALKHRFLQDKPTTDPRVDPYFRRYQHIFSLEGLPTAAPAELKEFANNSIGAHPGNMSVFNRAWNDLGDQQAAERVRRVIDYLLRGDDEPIEDRLQTLIDPRSTIGMTGFKESLLTRTLCVIYPEQFLPILTYTSPAGGKKEVAAAIFDLELPAPETTSMTLGRLVFWSNDLLRRLCGTGFSDVAHISEFLWWAKDQPR